MTPNSVTEFLYQCFNKRDYGKALQFLNEGIAGSTDSDHDGTLSYYAGRIHYYQDDLRKAREAFLQSLRRNPLHFYSKFYLGRTLERLGQTDDVMRIYADCLVQKPSFAQIADFVGSAASLRPYASQDLAFLSSVPGDRQKQNAPLISIVILCHNKLEYTERCIRSIFQKTDYPHFEVIVVDNASVDDTPAFLETYGKRIRFIHSDENLGFVGGNNYAAKSASGEFIMFLNNDTEVTEGWLTELYEMFVRYTDTGAAGSMLVYPNGRLQEAGGVIFQDASGWNFGKNGSPNDARYSFVREVDYCSGASLMVRRDLFLLLGGFDERFAPAYYEDTDLCFGIRKLGFKVRYCPFSHVIHHEGATAGTDLTSGFKRFQVLNAPKFTAKWNTELKEQYRGDPENMYLFSNRKRGRRILVIDDLPPLPDRAAGSLRLFHTVRQMVELGFQVTYVHLTGREFDDAAKKHLKELKALGVEFIWFEYETWWEIRESPNVRPILQRLINSLDLARRQFSLVYICFWHIAGYFIDLIRQADQELPVLIDSMDLHYLRESRQAETLGSGSLRKKAAVTRQHELAVYRKADCVTTVTESDRVHLQADLPGKAIFIMTDVHDPVAHTPPFEERSDFLYVGNFNHNPNEDAVLYFVSKIFPLIKRQLPKARFHVVGNNPTAKVKQLASPDVIVTGWVPEVEPFLAKCRVSVVPLRFGAGNKGKVGETLAHGLPMVSTSIGAEGMGVVNERHSFVGDDPQMFADYAVRLYNDKELWNRFSEAGKALIASQYSSALMRRRIEYITSYETRESMASRRALMSGIPPRVSIIILTHNQFRYTRECLTSIREYTQVPHEVIVVDNASTDDTLQGLERFPEVRLIRNSSNLGFPGGVNVGLNAALGECVVLLNNDTVVTEGWLERLLEVAAADEATGVVGVMSNAVSGGQQDPDARYETIIQMHEYAQKVRQSRKGRITPFPRVAFLCTLIKKSVFDRIGGLDERFTPGNFEDDDFCLRAQLTGFRTVIAEDVFVHHYGSRSFGADGRDAYERRIETNRQVFIRKWGADPVEIWKGRREFTRRNPRCPLNRDQFIQNFEQARILIEEKDMETALTALRKALRSFHSSDRKGLAANYTEVLNLTGNVALAVSDPATAQRCFEEELRLSPASARAREALDRLTGATNAPAPADGDAATRAVLSQAEVLSHCGRLSDAIGVLQEGITVHPDNPHLYRRLAWLLIRHKMFEDASAWIQRTPDAIKKQVEWLEIAGFCAEGQGLDDLALLCADKALQIKPVSAYALTLKGILASKAGNETDARRFLDDAVKSDTGLALPHLHMGALLWRSGAREEAFTHLEQAFVSDPADPEIELAFYSAAESLQRLETAGSLFEKAVGSYPAHKHLRHMLADVLSRMGKLPEAMNVAEDAMTLFGVDGDILPFALELRGRLGPHRVPNTNSGHASLSLCMIVKNEENYLARCLSSVKTLVDEMIVVDTGSSDRTRGIAEAFGALVYTYDWTEDFSEARNFSLSKATGDWILVLDGDEVISGDDLDTLERLVREQRGKGMAFSFTTRNYVRPTDTQGWVRNSGTYAEEAGTGWIPSEKVRLFPRIPSLQFRGVVHELVEDSLKDLHIPVSKCTVPIHHYGKLDGTKSRGKGEKYLLLGHKKLEETGPGDLKALSELAIQENELGNYQQALEICLRMIQLDPRNARAQMGVGSNYIGLDRFEDAVKPLKRALDLEPDLKEAYVRYAHALLMLGRAPVAIPVMRNLVKRFPVYPYSKAMLAAVLFCTGEKTNALGLLHEMRKGGVSFESFFGDLAGHLKGKGRVDDAVAILEPLYEENMISQETAVLLVECYKSQATMAM